MSNRKAQFSAIAAITILLGCGMMGDVASAQDQRIERITFARGTSSKAIDGQIKGYQYVDYKLNVRAGQSLNISLATRHTATYFNVLEPGSSDEAVFNGSTSDNQFEGVAAKSGDYTIRVYMMRSAARRGEVARYRLETIVGPGLAVQLPLEPGDALVPGTDYHATGQVRCTIGGSKSTWCDFGIKREGGGNGMVTVTKPDGRQRVVFFEGGKATGFDFSQADPAEFSSWRHEDTIVVKIGSEIYLFPDALVMGD